MDFTVSDNRIFKEENGKLIAEVTFPFIEDNVVVIDHTFVDPSLRGQGIADKLMQSAVKEISKNGWKAKATCPYAVKWFELHGDEFSVLK